MGFTRSLRGKERKVGMVDHDICSFCGNIYHISGECTCDQDRLEDAEEEFIQHLNDVGVKTFERFRVNLDEVLFDVFGDHLPPFTHCFKIVDNQGNIALITSSDLKDFQESLKFNFLPFF